MGRRQYRRVSPRLPEEFRQPPSTGHGPGALDEEEGPEPGRTQLGLLPEGEEEPAEGLPHPAAELVRPPGAVLDGLAIPTGAVEPLPPLVDGLPGNAQALTGEGDIPQPPGLL